MESSDRRDRDEEFNSAEEAYKRHDYETALLGYLKTFQLLADETGIAEDRFRLINLSSGEASFLGRILIRLQKTTRWMGLSSIHGMPRKNLLGDLRKILTVTGESELLASTYSGEAFEALVDGDPHRSVITIRRGLAIKPEGLGLRFLLDARAAIEKQLGFYDRSLETYRKIDSLDENLSISPESRALIEAGILLSEAHLSRAPAGRLLSSLENTAEICRRVGHIGFEVQIRNKLSALAIELGLLDTGLCAIERAKESLSGYQETFPKLHKRSEAIRLAGLLLSETQSEEVEDLFQKIDRIRWPRLREIAAQCLDAAVQTRWFALASGIVLLAELITRALMEIEQMELTTKRTSLTIKGEALFEAGMLSNTDRNRLQKIIELRNRLLHGQDLSIRLLHFQKPIALMNELFWLLGFLDKFQVFKYQPGTSLKIEDFINELASTDTLSP